MTGFRHLSGVAAATFLTLSLSAAAFAQEDEPGAPQQLTPEQAQELFQEGVTAYDEDNFEEAYAKFSSLLRIDPSNVALLTYVGLSLNGLEDHASAIPLFKQAIDLNGGAAAYNGRGEANLNLGGASSADLAYDDFEKAAQLDRNNPQILSNLGHVKINYLSDPVGALRDLEDATDLDPNDARAFRDMGAAHNMMGEYEEAIAALEQASEIEPDNYENYRVMAQVFLNQEEFDSAIGMLDRAIETYEPTRRTDPDDYLEGYVARADARLRWGNETIESDKEQSTAAFEAVISDADTILEEYDGRPREASYAYYAKGLAQRLLGRYGEAIGSLTQAVQTAALTSNPYFRSSDAYLRRGICWHNQGYEDLARKDFERSINFVSPLPHFWIGLSFATEGDYREAIKHYSEAVAKREDYALAYVNRGLAYYQLEDYEKAIDNFNEAISHEPLEASHYYKRGMAHMRLEQYDKAVISFADALLKDPDLTPAKQQMAKAQQALGNSNLAPLYQDDPE